MQEVTGSSPVSPTNHLSEDEMTAITGGLALFPSTRAGTEVLSRPQLHDAPILVYWLLVPTSSASHPQVCTSLLGFAVGRDGRAAIAAGILTGGIVELVLWLKDRRR